MSTDKSAAAVREFCERWSQEWDENTGWYKSQIMYDKMLPDLTALIEEHYVEREEHDKVFQQRDKLLKTMKSIYCTTDASDQTSMQHAIYRIGAAIKNTEKK